MRELWGVRSFFNFIDRSSGVGVWVVVGFTQKVLILLELSTVFFIYSPVSSSLCSSRQTLPSCCDRRMVDGGWM